MMKNIEQIYDDFVNILSNGELENQMENWKTWQRNMV